LNKSSHVDLIPLTHAVLCEDCGQISSSRTDSCSGCGSRATVHLASILLPAESSSITNNCLRPVSSHTLTCCNLSADVSRPARASNERDTTASLWTAQFSSVLSPRQAHLASGGRIYELTRQAAVFLADLRSRLFQSGIDGARFQTVPVPPSASKGAV